VNRQLYVLSGTCPDTTAGQLEAMAGIHDTDGRPVQAEWYRMAARRLRRSGLDRPTAPMSGPIYMHATGPRDPTMVCPCGHLAEYLCDEPLGGGRTCDGPMCRCCRTPIGDELDRCRFHVAASARPVP